jgi:hypothetical protein
LVNRFTRLVGNQLGGGGRGPIWGLAGFDDNKVVLGGEDRVVTVLDDRKWRNVDLWKTPLKHDIVGLLGIKKKLCVFGLDHEVVMRENEGDEGVAPRHRNNHRAYRARARWSGMCADEHFIYARDALGALMLFKI